MCARREVCTASHIRQGQPLAFYANWLKESGYRYASCVLPHDGTKRDGFTAVKFGWEPMGESEAVDLDLVRALAQLGVNNTVLQ